MHHTVYKIAKKLPFIRGGVSYIERRLRIIYPFGEQLIKETEKELFSIGRLVLFGIILALLAGQYSLYYTLSVIIMLYVVCSTRIYRRYDKLETKLMLQLEDCLQDIRYLYRANGMIKEALEECFQLAGREMQIQGTLILQSLNNFQNDGDGGSYEENAPNSHFLTFYALCETVLHYGDQICNGDSVFLKNIGYLKEEITQERLLRDKKNAHYLGLHAITVIPFFSIRFIELWGVSNMPALKEFYGGMYGKMVMGCMLIISLIIYKVILLFQYPKSMNLERSIWIEKLLKNDWINRFLLRIISKNYKKYYKKEQQLREIMYLLNVKELLLKQIADSICFGMVIMIFVASMGLFDRGMHVFSFVGILLIVCGMFVGAGYEEVKILVTRKRRNQYCEEEIVRFLSILLILRDIPRITIDSMVAWMEKFAGIFRKEMENIEDNLLYQRNEVFERAKDNTEYPAFERLMDAFIAVDRIGIASAFSDMEVERKYYIEKHKQENEIRMNQQAAVAKMISFLPLCLVILSELIAPFVWYGLNQLNMYRF